MKERPKRLLIIEANNQEAVGLKTKFEGLGYVVRVVQNIWGGLTLLESNNDYDLILANLNQNSLLVRQLAGAKVY